jgi:tetratricopeptide (TPR) repeat protein
MKKIRIILVIVVVLVITALLFTIKPYKERKAFEHNLQGKELYVAERFKEAKLSFEKAIKLNPQLTEAYINLAKTFLALERFDEAFATANSVINVDAANAEALTISGQAKLNEDDYPAAWNSLTVPLPATIRLLLHIITVVL